MLEKQLAYHSADFNSGWRCDYCDGSGAAYRLVEHVSDCPVELARKLLESAS